MCNYSDIIQAVRRLSKGEEAGPDISDILYRHRCNYLLSLTKDKKYLKTLAYEKFLSKMAVKERYKALTPFFENTDINYAVIKGAVLSLCAYNDPYLRVSGDIDILIDKKDSDKIKKELKALGFIQGRVTDRGIIPFSREEILFQTSMTHQTAPYVKETGNRLCPYVNIDINTDIMWGESRKKTDMTVFLQYSTVIQINDFIVKKLLPEAEFISLCMHHYKDFNSLYLLSKRGFCLGQYCDIYFYLKNMKPSVSRLQALSEQLKVGEYIYYCLYYTDLIFDDEDIKLYLLAFKKDKDETLLSSFGLCEDERKRWECGFFERIFSHDVNELLKDKLTQHDLEKIQINQILM